MSIIFKTFRTYAHPYVYDRHTNAVVMLTEDEYNELAAVEKGKLAAEDSAVIKRYQEQGLFNENIIKKIEHPATERIESYLKNRVKQLTLQVTQQCNLRCEYCVYSGVYEKNRTHNNARMSMETAQKAIDYFLEHNSNLANIIIGFYGGEPLLEFELIKKCVAYAKSRVEGKNILFNMTTNGTLLTDEMVDFLVENDFSLSISIDGSKEEHDRNRKFVNGKGSFDVIINNIKNIRGKYPEFEKNIQIMTTVNPYIDLGCVLEYFSTEEIFSDKSIMFNSMNENNLKEASTYDQKYYRIRNYEYIKMLFNLVGKLDKKYVSDLVHRSGEAIMHLSDGIGERSNLMEIMHHNGPCLPGVRKLFIRTDGKYYPCERVNEMQEYFCIGSINEGINVSKAKSLLNIGKLTEDLCKNCWAIRHCSMCAAQIEFNENLTYDDKVKKCNEMKQRALFNLQELCVLKEFGMANDNIRSLI